MIREGTIPIIIIIIVSEQQDTNNTTSATQRFTTQRWIIDIDGLLKIYLTNDDGGGYGRRARVGRISH